MPGTGEGSRGGQVVRHTAGGKAVYASQLSKSELHHTLTRGHFSIISAGRNGNDPSEKPLEWDDPKFKERHEVLRRDLEKHKLRYTEVFGKYGKPEHSFIVHHASAPPEGDQTKAFLVHHQENGEHALIRKLGKKFNQDSVIHANAGTNEMHFTTGVQEGKHHAGAGFDYKPGARQDFTKVPLSDRKRPVKFALKFDFSQHHPMRDSVLKSEEPMSTIQEAIDLLKASTGEGSRGGVVVGHTSGGDAVYQSHTGGMPSVTTSLHPGVGNAEHNEEAAHKMGETKSGKPVYGPTTSMVEHEKKGRETFFSGPSNRLSKTVAHASLALQHPGFSAKDHRDAAKLHKDAASVATDPAVAKAHKLQAGAHSDLAKNPEHATVWSEAIKAHGDQIKAKTAEDRATMASAHEASKKALDATGKDWEVQNAHDDASKAHKDAAFAAERQGDTVAEKEHRALEHHHAMASIGDLNGKKQHLDAIKKIQAEQPTEISQQLEAIRATKREHSPGAKAAKMAAAAMTHDQTSVPKAPSVEANEATDAARANPSPESHGQAMKLHEAAAAATRTMEGGEAHAQAHERRAKMHQDIQMALKAGTINAETAREHQDARMRKSSHNEALDLLKSAYAQEPAKPVVMKAACPECGAKMKEGDDLCKCGYSMKKSETEKSPQIQMEVAIVDRHDRSAGPPPARSNLWETLANDPNVVNANARPKLHSPVKYANLEVVRTQLPPIRRPASAAVLYASDAYKA